MIDISMIDCTCDIPKLSTVEIHLHLAIDIAENLSALFCAYIISCS